jgi:glycosyltransferase involved in cell wall biosynthesis
MKIAICHTDFRVYWPPRLAALANYLYKHGDNLHVIEIAGKGSPYDFAGKSNHAIFPCPWTCLFPEKRMEDIPPGVASARLYKALDSLCPDIVIAGAIAFPSGATALRWARRRKRPVVIMDDARLKDVPRSDLVNWLKRRIYANVDAIIIPAASHILDYRFWGIPEERMFFGVDVVDNTFFTTRSDLARQNHPTIRDKYGLPKKYFLGIGRQISKKNWVTLIKAFCASVREVNNDDWGLVLVGDGPEAPRLKEIAAPLGENVIFLPFQDQETLCQFYGLASCFVLPSIYGETWGNVVNEAMACRLPVIVSRECGCAQTLVQDGSNGWQFDPRDPGQLAQLLGRFMSMPEKERKLIGERSFEIIANWGLERFCDGVWQALQFCRKLPVRRYASPIIDRLILNLWKGRYRPV